MRTLVLARCSYHPALLEPDAAAAAELARSLRQTAGKRAPLRPRPERAAPYSFSAYLIRSPMVNVAPAAGIDGLKAGSWRRNDLARPTGAR